MADVPKCRLCTFEANQEAQDQVKKVAEKEGTANVFVAGYLTGMCEGQVASDMLHKTMCPRHRHLLSISALSTIKAVVDAHAEKASDAINEAAKARTGTDN